MKVTFFVEFFESIDNFCENFSCFFNREDFSGKFGLIVNEIATITILKNEVDIGLVFFHVKKFGDIRWMHAFHALYFSIEIFSEMRLGFNHFYWYQFESQQSAFLIFYQIDIAIGSFSQSLLILVLIQKHELIKIFIQ